MSIWALSDLHLAFGVPSKTMEVFGPAWKGYAEHIAMHWKRSIQPEDLVLISGDISWALALEDALIDLQWIDALPGTKVMVKGNHDYWWPSSAKLMKVLPPSIHFIHNNAFNWNGVTVGGARLWDTAEYRFHSFIDFASLPEKSHIEEKVEIDNSQTERIFLRELERLKLSLNQLDPKASLKIVLTHYPPIGADLEPSRAAEILEQFHIDYCVFGHLHNVKKGALPFGKARGVTYVLASCDYLKFMPIQLM